MATGSSQRLPVFVGKRRIPNVFQRETLDGITYEFFGRVNGKPKRVRLDARNVTEAVEAAALLRGDLLRGDAVVGNRTITMNTLIDQYLDHARTRLAPSTHDLYSQRLRRYVAPYVGRRKVADIDTSDIRALLDRMRDGRIRGSRGILSGATQHGVLVALGSLFRYAKKEKAISRSPLADLDRDDKPSAARQRQPRYLTIEQIDILMSKAGPQFRPLLTTIAFSGLRLREAIGLRWSDVDLEGGTITVNGQLGRDGVWTATTKTKASRGTVPLLPRVARELRSWRVRQGERGVHLIQPGAFVFTTATGQPQSGRNVLRAIYNAGDAAKLNGDMAKVNVHDLRHSVVSNALDNGFTLPEAARLARHASPRVTAAVYAGLLEGNEEKLAAKLVSGGFGS